MFDSWPETDYIHLFYLSLAGYLASCILYLCGYGRSALISLTLSTAVSGWWMLMEHPYLYWWDEQYHALVGKNLGNHLLTPTLYETPILEYDYRVWTQNHIWVHKQPLYLWQIALSIKAFGTYEWAVRLPSMIMRTIMPLMIYRIGKNAFDEDTGFSAALMFPFLLFCLELITGATPTDHNDMSFLFYVTAGIFSVYEYNNSPGTKWIIAVGFFTGCAILVKWLTGFLVIGVFAMVLMDRIIRNGKWKEAMPALKSVVITLAVFLPWQIYIALKFPEESAYERQFNTDHIFKAVEGHAGDALYHIDAIEVLYGKGMVFWIILAGLIWTIIHAIKTRSVAKAALVTAVIVVYAFFTMVATKMIAYCFIVSPLILICTSNMFTGLTRLIAEKVNPLTGRGVLFLGMIIFSWGLLKPEEIYRRHLQPGTDCHKFKVLRIREKLNYQSIPEQLRNPSYALFNPEPFSNAAGMFYAGITTYDGTPTPEQVRVLREKNVTPVFMDSLAVPEYVKTTGDYIVIKRIY